MSANHPAPVPDDDAARVRLVSGFYEEERDGASRFRWMRRAAVLAVEPAAVERYLELPVLSEIADLSQELRTAAGEDRQDTPLPRGWSRVSVAVPAGVGRIELAVNRIFPRAFYPGDARELAVRLARPVLHADRHRHLAVQRQHANAVANQREMLAGATELRSTPVSLGIDLHGVCNVNPPCVYCEWDAMKALEGGNARTAFTAADLDGYGPLYDNAAMLVNCSIGEPFMMRDLDALLDAFARDAKTLEMSSNGQILTDANIARLVGRDVHLYVSLDAARPETYARLRNDTFPRIIGNLRRLVAAKGGRGRLPFVFLVFMPMRANRGELPEFVRQCAELQVDCLVLRPLNPSPTVALRTTRAGYTFDYQRELILFDELVRLSGEADELCRAWGVTLANQLDFGGATGPQFQELFEQGRRRAAERLAVEPPPRPWPDAADTGAGSAEPAGEAPVPADPAGSPMAGLAAEGGRDAPDSEEPADFGLAGWPACTEPWRTLYILRRGVLPCCYGGFPIAPADGYREAWNGPAIQSIRRALAAGRFGEYCLRSPSCPIVRKGLESGALPRREARILAVHRAWVLLNRATLDLPKLLFRPVKPVVMPLLRRLGLPEPEAEPQVPPASSR